MMLFHYILIGQFAGGKELIHSRSTWTSTSVHSPPAQAISLTTCDNPTAKSILVKTYSCGPMVISGMLFQRSQLTEPYLYCLEDGY